MAKADAVFAKAVRPVVRQIATALEFVPFDRLPAAVRAPLLALKRSADEFLGARAASGATGGYAGGPPQMPSGPEHSNGPNGPRRSGNATSAEAARYGRTAEQYEALARDPSIGGKITDSTMQERKAALELELRGVLPGPIRRDPTGGADFVDHLGREWDVKRFRSGLKPRKGGFHVEKDAKKIQNALRDGERVIVDSTDLNPKDLETLRKEHESRGWGDKVVYWP